MIDTDGDGIADRLEPAYGFVVGEDDTHGILLPHPDPEAFFRVRRR